MSMSETTSVPRTQWVTVGVDGSEDGLRAVSYAVLAAQGRGHRLHLVHAVDDAVLAGAWGVVYDPTGLQKAGERVMALAVAHAIGLGFPANQIDSEVVLGNASAILTQASTESSLLVLGRRAVSGLERMFVGSTSVSVASTAHCPVVVISSAANPATTGSHGVVGVGVEGGKHSATTLEFAFTEASLRHHRVVAHAVQSAMPTGMFGGYRLTDDAMQQMVDATRAQLNHVVGQVAQKFPDVPYSCEVSLGHPAERLIELSDQVDLLVLGMRAPSVIGFAIGGVTRAVLAHARCPLAVVH